MAGFVCMAHPAGDDLVHPGLVMGQKQVFAQRFLRSGELAVSRHELGGQTDIR